MQHLPSTMRDVANGTLTELLGKLDTDELRRGKQFEKIVKWWLQNNAARTRNIKTVWLWDEWPDRPGRDIGVDLVAEMLDGSLCAIQAKCFNSDRDIPKSEIDSFISAASPRTFAQRWLVATTNGLSANARRTIHDNQVTFVPLAELDAAVVMWPSEPDSLKAVKKPGKAKPRRHQQRAIRDVLKGLEANSRGQLIMACGTGKTLTALWITERLDTNTTLVLVPSLNLLSQTLTEWAHNTARDWTYICVCSDDTVNKEDDQPINTTVDLPYPVTTKPSEIAHFLKSKGRKIVFSTYQSSAQVAKAQKLSGKKFDLTICDEAHRLTGKTDADYATVLDEKKIISKKRLFMTATPRTYTANVKAKAEERGVEITSMDDTDVYGPQFHRLTFGEAIKKELLTDYQVVIVGVTDPQVQDLIDRRELVSVNDTVTTDARTLAAHIGLAKATKDFDLSRTISFHSRIKTAAQFAEDHPKVLEWLPATHKPQGTTWTDTISGDMNTGQRRTLLQQLRKDQAGRHALLTNARCLTEGVDVPTLDGVAFIDPRSSQVDIIQAVGRAIRRSLAKNIGTIVLPVLIPEHVNPDEALSDSAFKPIWAIINALKAHDGQLAHELDQLRFAIGYHAQSRLNLPSKIVLDLPLNVDADAIDFSQAIALQIVDRTTPSWSFWYGQLTKYAETNGHSQPPQREPGIGTWVNTQRLNRRSGLLSDERKRLLEQLPGWSWNPRSEIWETGIKRTKEFVETNGHLRVTAKHREKDGYKLGQWITLQRHNKRKGYLDKSQILELESIPGWIWHGLDDKWLDGFESTKAFFEKSGHYEVPNSGHTYFGENNLRSWISAQRSNYRTGKLSSERAALLESLPSWVWDPNETSWNDSFEELKEIALRTGSAVVPDVHTSRSISDLQRWTTKQRTQYKTGKMNRERIEKLESLPGWEWKPHEAAFNYGLQQLAKYLSKYQLAELTHSFVDQDGFRLGLWVSNLRRRNETRKKALDHSQISRLRQVEPLIFEARTDTSFVDGCEAFRLFAEREGHSSIPREHIENGVSLHIWVGNRRQDYKKNRLSKTEIKALEALPNWSWHKFDDAWNSAFTKLLNFVRETGHADVPTKHIQDGFKLGSWVNGQRTRYSSQTLSSERVRKLQSVNGWTWKSKRLRRTNSRTKSVPKGRRNQ